MEKFAKFLKEINSHIVSSTDSRLKTKDEKSSQDLQTSTAAVRIELFVGQVISVNAVMFLSECSFEFVSKITYLNIFTHIFWFVKQT
jgi:hypothetical protein